MANGYLPYTDSAVAGSYAVFPSHAHQILSDAIPIVGTSILAFCLARRTDDLTFTRHCWANLTWTKISVIAVFLDSWLFLALAGILVNGVGLSYSQDVCGLAIYACIVFYAASKALIYCFLVERVWVVWSAGKYVKRTQSLVYKICAAVVLSYIVIFVLMLLARVFFIRDDGTCVIGLQLYASIPLMSFDLLVNILLTLMFVWPLYAEGFLTSKRLKAVAWRTLAAAAVALTTSSVNIVILTALHGRQLGWVCLGSCSADVTINAMVLFWVTASQYRENNRSEMSLPPLRIPPTNNFDLDDDLKTSLPSLSPDVPEQHAYQLECEAGSSSILETPTSDQMYAPPSGQVKTTVDLEEYDAVDRMIPLSPVAEPEHPVLPLERRPGRPPILRAVTSMIYVSRPQASRSLSASCPPDQHQNPASPV